MSKVIEILDSDDDIEQPVKEVQVRSQQTQDKLESSKPPDAAAIKQNTSISNKSAKEVENNTTPPKAKEAPALTHVSESPTKTRTRHRRKSTHQHMRASPDMQFETITLDDEDDEVIPGTSDSVHNSQAKKSITKPAKFFKTTPKILGTKPPTTDEVIQNDFEDFLANDEINSMVRQIAEERIRINFLLASYGMPDISFSLYTNYERLKFQFEDRVKQRKMRSWNRSQDTKAKKSKTQEGANCNVSI